MGIFEKIFGTTSTRALKKIEPIVNQILTYDEEYKTLSDKDLQGKTLEFRTRLQKGEELDSLLPEAFAVCREASSRVLGMKHFPVQLYGGVVLHQGRIAEMQTGEGKTLVATLPVYLNALSGAGVYVVTVNDYLAKRDSEWMGKLYNYLGMTTGLIVHDLTNEERKSAYSCDITYGTNNEIGFDYLRDNMVYKLCDMVQRPYNFAIIDEVDSILIDEARTPLIISGFNGEVDKGYKKANDFVRSLHGITVVDADTKSTLDKTMAQLTGTELLEAYSEYDYVVEEKRKSVSLTAQGVMKAEYYYSITNLGDIDNLEINHYITCSLKAYGLFKLDRDYVVKDNKVVIVDESTGRLMDGRRYSDGIHQSLEEKEGVEVQQESTTLATITFQNFFRKFPKLSGMTGTAMTEAGEFSNIYNLDIVSIPTNKPILRQDKPDRVYITRDAKLRAIVGKVKECVTRGQPILVGTVSVAKSEELSELFKQEGIEHTVLNAKYHAEEARIIAQAGRFGAVTIATNMAGRGTDIILGGNTEYLTLAELEKRGYSEALLSEATSHSVTTDPSILEIRSEFKKVEERIKGELQAEVELIKGSGGLYILGSERHESRRIDNQLRGRAGRQGDEGVSEFVLSLEDDLMRIFGSEKLVSLCSSLSIPADTPIDAGLLSNSIEKAQKRIEGNYFAARKQVLEYDEVFAIQRDIVYKQRLKLLESTEHKSIIVQMMRDILSDIVESHSEGQETLTESSYAGVVTALSDFKRSLPLATYVNGLSVSTVIHGLQEKMERNVEELCKTADAEFVESFSYRLLLFLVDSSWKEQMIEMESLKEGIGLRAYAQVDPIQAYKIEGFDLFEHMTSYIKEEVLKSLMGAYEGHVLDVAEEVEASKKSDVVCKSDTENKEFDIGVKADKAELQKLINMVKSPDSAEAGSNLLTKEEMLKLVGILNKESNGKIQIEVKEAETEVKEAETEVKEAKEAETEVKEDMYEIPYINLGDVSELLQNKDISLSDITNLLTSPTTTLPDLKVNSDTPPTKA